MAMQSYLLPGANIGNILLVITKGNLVVSDLKAGKRTMKEKVSEGRWKKSICNHHPSHIRKFAPIKGGIRLTLGTISDLIVL